MKKKIFSILVSIGMLISFMPVSVSALNEAVETDSFEKLKQAIFSGEDHILVTSSFAFEETIVLSSDIQIEGKEMPKLTRAEGFEGNMFQITGDGIMKTSFSGLDFDGLNTKGEAFIKAEDTNTVFKNCTFENNIGKEDGVALHLTGGSSVLEDCSFLSNKGYTETSTYGYLHYYGGAAFNYSGIFDLVMNGCSFRENESPGSGGAFTTDYDGWRLGFVRNIEVNDCEFLYNKAVHYGEAGAFFVSGAYLNVNDSVFNNNYGGGQCGAVLTYWCDGVFNNCEFKYNTSDGCSGAFHSWCSYTELNNVEMSYNSAALEGGAMCIYCNEYLDADDEGVCHFVPSVVTLNGGIFSHNKTVGPEIIETGYSYPSAGGAFFVHDGGELIMNDGIIEENESLNDGGAVYVDDGGWLDISNPKYDDKAGIFVMNGGIIRNNLANRNGGAVYVNDDVKRYDNYQGVAGTFIMNDGTIRDNRAVENGGGVYLEYRENESTLQMTGGHIFDNLASDETTMAGDDVYDMNNSRTNLIYTYEEREYGDILKENVFLTPVEGYPLNLKDDAPVCFIGWFEDNENNRYIDPIRTVQVTESEGPTDGLKAIWGGLLVVYDANNGKGDYQYSGTYKIGEDVSLMENPFENPGKEFLGWTLEKEGKEYITSVSSIQENTIVYGQWKDKTYHVSYQIEDDPKYGRPKDSVIPEDLKDYFYNDTVIVVKPLSSTQTDDGNGTGGVWSFTWDRGNFSIVEDTLITGTWKFTPATKPIPPHIVPDTSVR